MIRIAHSLVAALVLTSSISAFADGRQVCVDSKGDSYTVKVSGFARDGEQWSGILTGGAKNAIASGTDLNKIAFKQNLADSTSESIIDLSYSLKHLVAPADDSLREDTEITYSDEPRVYQAAGVDLLCSSTMSEEEFNGLQK